MFNDKYGLTQAVLEGRKTQTRRLITPQPCHDKRKGMVWKGYMYGIKGYNAPYDAYDNFISPLKKFNRLPYNIDEEIAVAQSYKDVCYSPSVQENIENELGMSVEDSAGHNNKMFVRAYLMPHRIKITNVRIERLQDISDKDCLQEGLEFAKGGFYTGYNKETNSRTWLGNTPREAFAALIDKVSGKGTWDSNPYVFVYDFIQIK